MADFLDTTTQPRILWMYWAQGWEAAPDLVSLCRDSWIKTHPGWTIRLLDAHSSRDWVPPSLPELVWEGMSVAHQAGVLRLLLLAKYGGVWADATCLAMQPLDHWLQSVMPSGFFAFRWLQSDTIWKEKESAPQAIGKTRKLASWFLASRPGNALTNAFADAVVEYWSSFPPLANQQAIHRRVLRRCLLTITKQHPDRAAFWTSHLAAHLLRVRPYLVLNAVFTRLIQSDAAAEAIWSRTPSVSATFSHRLQELSLRPDAIDHALARGVADASPVQKLDWRVSMSAETRRALARATDVAR